jgi:predicted PurR-regulated permease PerM
MLGVILLAQNVVQPIVQRQLERNALDLHPIAGFGSTIIGSVLFGILGATLSAPFVAMAMRVRDRIRAFERGEISTVGEAMADPDRAQDEQPDSA